MADSRNSSAAEPAKQKMADTSDREIISKRVFDAPRNLVFKMWTDPKHLAQWWGPNGFTTTVRQMDVRPGGLWRMVMHGPDGRDYNNRLVFLEVVEPERLVYKTDREKDSEPVDFQVFVTFTARGDKTEITLHMVFPSAAECDRVVTQHRAIEGAEQTLARLAEHLARL